MRVPNGSRDRRTYIGGHDASAIVGLNPYRNAADVYAKVVHGATAERTPRMLRGLIVEPGLINYAAEMRSTTIARDVFYVDDKVPFFAGSVDGVEGNVDRPKVLHEGKSTLAHGFGADLSERWGPSNSDDVERVAWLQCQWYMGLSGASEAHVWLLVLDDDEEPRHYRVERNHVSIRELRSAAEQFWWDHIAVKIPPALAPKSEESARAMAPKGVRDMKLEEITPELVAAAQQYAWFRKAAQVADEAKKNAGAVLRHAMGRAEKAKWPGGSITYRESEVGKPNTNWEQVAHELALRHRIDGTVFHGIVKEQTKVSYSGRRLTVTIKDPTKQKAT
jgi:predicted phage-related endonuclease